MSLRPLRILATLCNEKAINSNTFLSIFLSAKTQCVRARALPPLWISSRIDTSWMEKEPVLYYNMYISLLVSVSLHQYYLRYVATTTPYLSNTAQWKSNQQQYISLHIAQHSHLLTDATGKTDPFFYIRTANSNLESTTITKLLINKVILAWKLILRDKLEVANYITTAFLWVSVKAQLNPILYELSDETSWCITSSKHYWTTPLTPHPPSHYGTQLSNPTMNYIQIGHQPMMAWFHDISGSTSVDSVAVG
jgi:hypothetical protein